MFVNASEQYCSLNGCIDASGEVDPVDVILAKMQTVDLKNGDERTRDESQQHSSIPGHRRKVGDNKTT